MSTHENLSFQANEPKQEQEESYIDMELSPKTTAPQITKPEFEFQTANLAPSGKDPAATFPADDLFYKGKLLPLLLPSRRQMLRHLASPDRAGVPPAVAGGNHVYHSTPPTNALNTPSDSCNISPSESCRASCELNPDDDYLFQWSTDFTSFMCRNQRMNHNDDNGNSNHNYNHGRKKLPWPKKLRLTTRQYSALGRKLKASRAYLRSFFIRSACSDESSAEPRSPKVATEHIEFDRRLARPPTIAAIMKGTEYKNGAEHNSSVHRRSFSSAIKRHSPVKCLSSSSSSSSGGSSSSSLSSVSSNSGGFTGLRRSSSATETEGSIEAAIAHCKRTHEALDSRKTDTVAGILEFSVPKNGVEGDDQRTGVCSN